MMKLKNHILRIVMVAAMICLPHIASADTTLENGSDTILFVDSLSLQAKSTSLLSASTTATSSDTIKVKTASEFCDAVKNYPNGMIALCNDITFGNKYDDYSNIADEFTGSIFTVAGADTKYAIKGLKCNVFNTLSGANIHDIIIKDFSYRSNDTRTGTIASIAYDCTFSNIDLYNVSLGLYDDMFTEADRAGGLIGLAKNCTFTTIKGEKVTVHICGYKAGGISGYAKGCTFKDCIIDATCLIYAEGSGSSGNAYCGGICGHVEDSKIDNCISSAIVGGDDDRIGGIVGGAEGSSSITNNSVFGIVTQTTFSNLSGYQDDVKRIDDDVEEMFAAVIGMLPIARFVEWPTLAVIDFIPYLYNASGNDEVGGIAGWCGPGSNIDRCTNYATVQCADAYSGGICGYFDGNRITNCYNYGSVVGDEEVGGIAGSAYAPTISGCVNFGDIQGDSNTGGLVGYGEIGYMHDCVNIGKVTLTEEDNNDVGGLCGSVTTGSSNNKTYVRCFNYGNVCGNGECTMGENSGVSEDSKYLCIKNKESFNNFSDTERRDLANGLYALSLTIQSDGEGIEWYQDIDANKKGFTYPIPRPTGTYTGTDRLIPNILCDGTFGASNIYGSTGKHTAVDDGTHHCSICGNVIVTTADAAAGITPIYTAADMIRLAHQVNCGVLGQKVKMYNDIDMKDVDVYLPVGVPAAPFKGTFDGQFNKLTNLNCTTNAGTPHAGVFECAGNGCQISNLVIDSTCSFTTTGDGAGGIVGAVYSNPGSTCNVVITKCGNEAKIRAVKHAGGIIGGVYNNDNTIITIENCYNSGSVGCTSFPNAAAICGYARKNYIISKCWNSGTVEACSDDKRFVNYLDYDENEMSDCYDIRGIQTYVNIIGKGEISSGRLCWMLNGSNNSSTDDVWYQLIGTDEHPVFVKTDDNKVYHNKYCDNSDTYANKVFETDEDKHNYNDDGICLRASGEIHGAKPDYDDVNKVWNITKPGHLYWIANKVNNNTSSELYNCNLMNDIVVNKNVLVDDELNSDADAVAAFLPWTPIGDETAYDGTFNGNGHTISGLYINGDRTKYTGLFGTIFEGANVSNLGVTDCYFNITSGIGIGALAGAVTYDETSPSITNCYTTGIINGPQDIGGLVGDIYGNVKVNIGNCYSQCKVKGTNSEKLSSVGALIGYAKSGAKISTGVKNCYYTASNTNGENECGTDKSLLAFRLGEVCQKLNSNTNTNLWAQNLETMTLPGFGTTDVTYERSVSYRWGSLILPFEVSSNSEVQYYAVKNLDSDNNLHLTALDKVEANTPCFFRVAEGTDKFSVASPTNGCVTPSEYYSIITVNGLEFFGLYGIDHIGGSNAYYLAHDQLWQAGDDVRNLRIYPYRAGLFVTNSSAKSISIVSPEDETTAIGEITTDGVNLYDGPVYNIAGQKLNALQKGQVNIINGKKVMIK